MMESRTSEQKIRIVLRSGGVVCLLLGLMPITMAIYFFYRLFESLFQGNWSGAVICVIPLAVFLGLTIVFMNAGWSFVRRPDSANPRSLLIALFVILYSLLYGIGSSLLFSTHQASDAREILHPWELLYGFVVMMICSMLYYTCLRRLSRLATFTPAQRAKLADPPSIQFCGLLGFMLLGVLLAFLWSDRKFPGNGWLALLHIPALLFVYWFYRRLYHFLVNYLAAPPGASATALPLNDAASGRSE